MADVTIKLTNNLPAIKANVKKAAQKWLEETSGEIEAQTKRNTRVDTGQTKNSWTHQVDATAMEAVIGSPLQNAIWEEYGTGEFAINGDGRSGYWVFVKDGSGGSSSASGSGGKTYSLAGAKMAVAILRSKGLDAYYTRGKTPNPAMHNAWDSVVPKAKKALPAQLQKISNV